MTSPLNLSQRIHAKETLSEIAAYLDQLSADERRDQSQSLGSRDQKLLWSLCEGSEVTIDQMVPPERAGQTVRHIGRNTLPVFKLFEKRFYRPSAESAELWGYNEGSTRPLVGPGYFVCHMSDQDESTDAAVAELVINYERLPEHAPEGWPEVRFNERGISKLVYAFMHDYMRRVSEHITIGRAYRKGAESPNYFTLCRWDE